MSMRPAPVTAAPVALRSRRPRELCDVKWLQCVERFSGLRLQVPFEHSQLHLVLGEVGESEAVLLDGLDLL